jgi:2-desacetyl-2-hydroxyethyl bacteriochlorophyllide A dehydrogenase
MRAVRFDAGAVRVVDVPRPPGDGVRVRVRGCGICGSDLSILASGFPLAGIPGHELAGELEDGTPVAIEPVAPCGACEFCARGDYQVCRSGNAMIVGIGRDGGMAEELVVPERCLVRLPGAVRVEDACLVEPLAVAVHGLRRAGVRGGERVCVVGGGAIGLCAVAASVAAGCETALVARHPAQAAAGRRLGAVAPPGGEYDVAIDCAGTPSAAAECCERLRSNGTLLLLAAFWDAITLPGLPVAAKELSVVASTMYGRLGAARDVDAAAALLAARPAIAEALITHRYPLEAAADAFAAARDRAAGAIKVVIEPP